MPKRTDIGSICIIGAGPIIIGQACEFDYSGTQAVKALKAEGYRVVLVNSNPATIMTDPGLADATYIEPVTPDFVARVLERERPDALLPTMGGQTALNVAMKLADDGTLDRLGVELIGANRQAIAKAEDRLLFRDAMTKIGLESPKSRVARTLAEAREALAVVGLPAIIRPSFTLGGTGGGIAYNRAQFEEIAQSGIAASPVGEVLVEESVLGWKEFEMEVVRDRADNCIIICSIENVDPMGVHTGDSITVAPALTLTDKEYQLMREASFKVLREIGVDTGGSNVQFAINPEDGRMVVIEMNPRVSRSSALASKATGFPIAKVAAKLAVGYTLDEIQNEITGTTPAAFEPTIDYVVVKIPRFAFEKFPGAEPTLTTSMKSVGEAMAIGRSFPEAMQKALRSLETGFTGFSPYFDKGAERDQIRAALSRATPERILVVADALRDGMSAADVAHATKIDPWFVGRIAEIVAAEQAVVADLALTPQRLADLRRLGFGDTRLRELGVLDAALAQAPAGLAHVFKRIDTCAAEFDSQTPYLYGTYETLFAGNQPVDDAAPSARRKVMILGGGPNRIGQGIEFDYCCVHASYALREAGLETIMVNCNPETVSTDYDTSDRLYFEPLSVDDVLAICRREASKGELLGVIVQFGGQTPLKLAHAIETAGFRVLGTTPDAIDLAEDRERFSGLLKQLGLKQPPSGVARTEEEAERIAGEIGYPVLLRPSYVLGGRAMEIVHDRQGLTRYVTQAVKVSGSNPVLVDRYLADAIEVDVDALADGQDVYVAGIMEHIEEAGIHSGDSACALPPFSLDRALIDDLTVQTKALARGLGVVGLMNVQFAVKDRDLYVLEANPRASRTVPFVAKATGVPIAKLAARVMAGERLADLGLGDRAEPSHVAVKEAVFPFARFPGVDVILGPEMRSTGEVMGLDRDFATAFLKSQTGAGVKLPLAGEVFMSVRARDKQAILPVARRLIELGFGLVATAGTAERFAADGIYARPINKVLEGSPHVVDAMIDGQIALVINTTEGAQAIADSFSIRRTALMQNVPYYTTVAGARAAAEAIAALKRGTVEVAPLQAYLPPPY